MVGMNDSRQQQRYPSYRNHFRPRTRRSWLAMVLFLLLFSLTQPPVVYLVANRVEPWVLGLPFLYSYLLVLYFALIGVLIWAVRRRL